MLVQYGYFKNFPSLNGFIFITGKIAISKSGGRQTQFTPGTDTDFSDYMGKTN